MDTKENTEEESQSLDLAKLDGKKKVLAMLNNFDPELLGKYMEDPDVQESFSKFNNKVQERISKIGGNISSKIQSILESAKQKFSPEQLNFLDISEKRFYKHPEIHEDLKWESVINAFIANPETIRTLMILDEAGFEMNVFGIEYGNIVFRMTQTDITKIDPQYRDITYYDAEKIAEKLGVEIADTNFYKDYPQFKINHDNNDGCVWLKSNINYTGEHYAYVGRGNNYRGTLVDREIASYHSANSSFCPMLRIKKFSI